MLQKEAKEGKKDKDSDKEEEDSGKKGRQRCSLLIEHEGNCNIYMKVLCSGSGVLCDSACKSFCKVKLKQTKVSYNKQNTFLSRGGTKVKSSYTAAKV